MIYIYEAWYTGVQWSFIIPNIQGEGRVTLRRDKSEIRRKFDRRTAMTENLLPLYKAGMTGSEDADVNSHISLSLFRERNWQHVQLSNAEIHTFGKNISQVDRRRVSQIKWYENALQKIYERIRKTLRARNLRILDFKREIWLLKFLHLFVKNLLSVDGKKT